MRKGRYKKNFISESEGPAFAKSFFPLLQELLQKWRNSEVSEAEFVAEYLLSGLKILRPNSWKGSRLSPGEPESPLETFFIFSLRGIPLAGQKALQKWSAGDYELQLFFDVPSTEKVLNLQSEGIRCVTCVVDLESLSRYVMGERDPISFTLHDLIHAEHFFHSPEQRQVQIGFSKWMRELWPHSKLQNELEDSDFATQFEYACADMNSHGAHLVKYLKAIFCQRDKENLLLELAEDSRVSPTFLEALHCLNSPHEKIEHLQVLQKELLLKGASAGQNQKHDSVIFREFDTI